jgi:flagellin-like hook-associated protein FlgL
VNHLFEGKGPITPSGVLSGDGLSSISANLASVIEAIKARNADPAEDPAKALRRLGLPGKAGSPYTDVVRLGASDLAVVARTLDDEHDRLQAAGSRVAEADAALTRIEEILKEASDLVESNARGAGSGRRKANQRKVDGLLDELDAVARDASKDDPDLFSGRTTLKAGDASVDVDAVSREALGRLVLNGKVMSLADVVRRGGLDSSKNRTAAEGARKSLADATATVTSLKERLLAFNEDSLRPRVGDLANALAGIFTDASGLGSSEAAVQTARELRDITLASTTTALAVGAEGWDRERVLDLLT